MKLHGFALALAPLAALSAPEGLLAIRVGRAETVANGTIENAVILVEGSRIVTIGEDLPVQRGIPIADHPDWVVVPGLVNSYSRLGMDGKGGGKSTPEVHASGELYPDAPEYAKVLEYGVTTLVLYPPGTGIPGQAVAVKPHGDTAEEMILKDGVYLKVVLSRTKGSKKMLRDGFDKADKYAEKEKKAREKWDKEQEKKKSAKKKDTKKEDAKKDEKEDAKKEEGGKLPQDDKGDEKKDEGGSKGEKEAEESSDVYVPPEPEPDTQVFLDLRAKKIPALVHLEGAAEYMHFLDALGDESIDWRLRIVLERESDIFYVLDRKTYDLSVDGIGDRKVQVVVEPRITYHPGTMRQRNLPAELVQAGARLVLVPNDDSLFSHERWLVDVGDLVGKGLDEQVALRAMTLEPAELVGLADRVGSLEKGKDANMVFLDGDPFEPATRIRAVMLEGEVVFGEVNP